MPVLEPHSQLVHPIFSSRPLTYSAGEFTEGSRTISCFLLNLPTFTLIQSKPSIMFVLQLESKHLFSGLLKTHFHYFLFERVYLLGCLFLIYR